MNSKELLKYAKEQGLVITHKEANKLTKQTNQDRFLKDLFKRKGLLWKKNKEIKILKEELLICQICDKYFKNKISLWNHVRFHRREIEKSKELEKEKNNWRSEYFKLNMKKNDASQDKGVKK